MLRKTPIAIALLLSHNALIQAQESPVEQAVAQPVPQTQYAAKGIEQTTIIGSKEQAATLPGSAYVLSNEDLEVFSYKDINSILRDVPGVYLGQEEGFGLRPSIGIRGAIGDRNDKITVMEDGILIAPAPYSGPAAYYFPSAGRLYSMEVLKGPATIAYGPFTVGGALNLVSTPIPEKTAAKVNLEVGQNGEQRLHAWAGSSTEQTGFLLETFQQTADGFQTIDRNGDDTGFEKQDYLLKGRWNTAENTAIYQQFDLKLSYAKEESDQTYLGLTDADFEVDPDRRYGLTALDNMDSEHFGMVFSHLIKFNDDISLSTDIYRNKFERNWYKVNRIGGSSLASVIDDANEVGNITENGWLDGSIDTTVEIKNNDREYISEGIQTALSWQFETGTLVHDLKTGLRLHKDEVDRFQPEDTFDQINGELIFQSNKLPDSSDNRLQEAEALSVFITDTIMINDDLDITAGLRFEDYETTQTKRNLDGSVDKKVSNSVSDFLPALGATYQLNDRLQLLAGYTKGFAVTDAGAENTDPEKSDNFELGGRYIIDALRIDLIGFYSDYSNAVKNCTLTNPCDSGNQVSGSESQGTAEVKGVEFLTNYSYEISDTLSMPVSFSYTYTDAKITEDSDTGDYLKGDVMAQVPEHLFSASIGLSAQRWDTYLKAAYTDASCPSTDCARSNEPDRSSYTDDLLTFDWVGSYMITDQWSTYARVENLADERAIVSRLPAGARVNKPRSAYVGITWQF